MKILVIPDVHQTTNWQDIVLDPNCFKEFDKVIQLGDWFDNWNNDWRNGGPIENFKKAIELTKSNDKFDVLLGNHDFSYISEQHCSGYQAKHANAIYKTIFENADFVNIAVEYDGWVFSHAGVSRIWMDDNQLTNVSQINDVFHHLTIPFYKAEKEFKKHCGGSLRFAMKNLISKDELIKCGSHFTERDEATFEEAKRISKEIWGIEDLKSMEKALSQATSFEFNGINCYGDDPWQTPLWIRPNSLVDNMYFSKQCVGHTEYEKVIDIKEDGKHLLVVDSPMHDFFIEIDTETETIKKIK